MTALQTLIAKWETELDNSEDLLEHVIYARCIGDAKKQLAMEREQIETAYYEGGDDVCPNGEAGAKRAAKYYEAITNG